MKKIFEILAVLVVVLGLISVGVFLSRGPGSDTRAASGGADDEAPAPAVIGGGP